MNYYFLGIGGIGMSALARFFKLGGNTVSGYDRTPSPLTSQLEAEGISIHYDDNPDLIPDGIDLVVYTPAVPKDTREFQHLEQSGVPMKKRSQVLGELTRGKKCIAVAGSHGKTTTSTMIAYLLSKTDIGCSAFLGGISKNFDSNLLVNNESPYVVVEADEYDRSFLQLHPYYSVITATDPDHLDIYGTHENLIQAFQQFANQTNPEGALFLKEGLAGHDHHHHDEDEGEDEHEHEHHLKISEEIKCFSYSARSIEPDFYAINVRNYNGNIYFDLRTPDKVLYDIELQNSCLYNVENAVAASAVALACGLDEYQLRYGLKTFAGIRRRFDVRVKTKDVVYIDDYAHHPKEIAATIESIKYLYPDKRIVGIFQPHLYTRTRDFADQFVDALKPLDEIILMPIYPAREKPIPGISSGMLLRKMDTMNKYLCSADQVPDLVEALCPDVVVTLGAGDIDRLVPVLEQRLKEE
ncbi:MAG: UDP-N-acetylmuramate--L-alanine ligase [Bacteroidales bacterium]|nr:UDP-N-acetylmuramate--L-alanine ligase [Bacteroidales bacterium]